LVRANQQEGKLGVLVLAPTEGLGVTEMRCRLLDRITLFRRPPSSSARSAS
jgi:hypothetical protein